MVISNLKIETSYFFTLLKEFAKENIRYHKDKGRVQLRRIPAQARLSSVPQHKKEMDHALGELVLNRSATMYKVRGSI